MTAAAGAREAKMDSSWNGFKLRRSDVRIWTCLSVVLCLVSMARAEPSGERESRKLFGGYRITPSYCKATRASRYNHGSTICMFNHECVQRGGEVVGACMDGFLFGACCQLKEDSQLHIPKGPGIVMTSYLDHPTDDEDEIDESDQISHWHDTYKPVIIPGYKPGEKHETSTKKPYEDKYDDDDEISHWHDSYKPVVQPGYTPDDKHETPTNEAYEDKYDDEDDEISHWHDSFKPVITPGYKPTESYDSLSTKENNEIRTTDLELPSSPVFLSTTTESINSEFSEGLSQITNSLLNSPPKDSNIIYVKPGAQEKPLYSHSTISHEGADTILLHHNGSEVDDISRPSDFNIQISSMQTKPTIAPITSTTTVRTVSTHRPIYNKPIFRPKPTEYKPQTKPSSVTKPPPTNKVTLVTKPSSATKPVSVTKPSLVTKGSNHSSKPISTTEKYVQVATVTNDKSTSVSSSIDSIMQMLNESSPSIDNTTQSAEQVKETAETKTSPASSTGTVTYTSSYPNYHVSTGHYVTIKPSSNYLHSSTLSIQSSSEQVSLPQYTQTSKPVYINNKYSTSPNIDDRITTLSYVSSSKPPSYYDSTKQSTSSGEKIAEEDRLTTVSYVSTTTTRKPPAITKKPTTPIRKTPTTTTRKPPSTSYVYSSKPSNRPTPSTNLISSYDVAPETFASVTPTVIVLNGFQTPKPIIEQDFVTEEVSEGESGFIEISQEPFKKPVHQLTVNNYISSIHNINVAKPGPSEQRPSSPTVVITPKPTPSPNVRKPTKPPKIEDPIINASTGFIVKQPSVLPTTIRPEYQTSPDDLINFPPVRNPMLNVSGANPNLYNTSVVGNFNSEDDLLVLHEVEFTTPSFLQEDDVLNDKMNVFVNKIVGSLQGTFQELHDIVILDKKPNVTITKPDAAKVTTTPKPTKKPALTTKKPTVTTKRPPVRATTTTKKPTKKPIRATTRRPVTTTQAPTTTTTKKPVTTTKKPRPTKRITTTTQPPTSTTTEFYEDVTTEESTTSNNIDYTDKKICGVRPLVKSGRIVGGKGATFGEWPWQVLVRESTWLGLFTKNKCGGVLITNKFVTTAAHCQPGFLASLIAVFGEHDISGDLESKKPVSRNVRRVIVHRNYNGATFENDLALLELESPIHFDAHIVPICMPPDEGDYTGRMATVTGWGRLKYGGGVPAVLQEVQVPVIENSVCQEMFQTAGHTKVILESFLCAGYANGQKDSCEGDSGGPLVLQRPDGKWQLVGTVSHGIKCAAPYLPGVYMRTTYYKPWLKSITGVH